MRGERGNADTLLEYKEKLLLTHYHPLRVLEEKDLLVKATALKQTSLLHKMAIEEDSVRARVKRIANSLCVGNATDEELEEGLSNLYKKIVRVEHEKFKELKCAKSESEEYSASFKCNRTLGNSYEIVSAVNDIAYWKSALVAAKKSAQMACEAHPDIESKSGQEYLKYRQRLEEMII